MYLVVVGFLVLSGSVRPHKLRRKQRASDKTHINSQLGVATMTGHSSLERSHYVDSTLASLGILC